MSFISIGDMAQVLIQRRRSADMTQHIGRLTEELSSARVFDRVEHLKGDTRALASVEHALVTLDAFQLAAKDAARVSRTMQIALDRIQSTSQDLTQPLFAASGGPEGAGQAAAAHAAHMAFEDMVSALNTRLGARSLFAGAASDRPAVATAETMLAALRTEIAGVTDPALLVAEIEAWFAPGGGFDALGYRGDNGTLGGGRIAPGVEVGLELRANDPAVRATLAATALAALSTENGQARSGGATALMLEQAGTRLLEAQTPLGTLRSRLGEAEARIDANLSRNAAERTALLESRDAMIGKDPFETVTELEDLRLRLDALYRVTVRTSELSLAGYL